MSERCAVIAAAERRSLSNAETSADRPAGRSRRGGRRAVSAAASGIGLAIALAGRAVVWPRLPASVSAVTTLVDYQPRLCGARWRTASVTPPPTPRSPCRPPPPTRSLRRRPRWRSTPVVHTAKAAESRGRGGLAAPRTRTGRPRAVHRPGAGEAAPVSRCRPVERHGDRSGLLQGSGGPTIGSSPATHRRGHRRDGRRTEGGPHQPGDVRRHALPRPDRASSRRTPLQPRAFRHLDRVDAVVLDPRVLESAPLRVGRIRDVADDERRAAWSGRSSGCGQGAAGRMVRTCPHRCQATARVPRC